MTFRLSTDQLGKLDKYAKFQGELAGGNDSVSPESMSFRDMMLIAGGVATIGAGNQTITVTLPSEYSGKLVGAMIVQAAADATLTNIDRCAWSAAGVLTIEGNAASTAAVTVHYFVLGHTAAA